MAAACGQVHYSARLVKLQELFLPCRGAHWAARRVSVHWGEISPPVFLWPSPWGEGGPKGRMRGQSKEQASLEKLCRAGACPAASVHSFPGMRRGFRRCCGELLCPWRQSNQNATGDGSGWTLRVHIRLPYPLWPFGPSPPDRGSRPRTPFTRVTPLGGQYPSGAQNLSGFPRFPPVHWALGVQKLPLVRFSFRAWVSGLMWLGGYRRRGGYQPPATPPAGPLGP